MQILSHFGKIHFIFRGWLRKIDTRNSLDVKSTFKLQVILLKLANWINKKMNMIKKMRISIKIKNVIIIFFSDSSYKYIIDLDKMYANQLQ
jgi:hypothetical protein